MLTVKEDITKLDCIKNNNFGLLKNNIWKVKKGAQKMGEDSYNTYLARIYVQNTQKAPTYL